MPKTEKRFTSFVYCKTKAGIRRKLEEIAKKQDKTLPEFLREVYDNIIKEKSDKKTDVKY